MEVALWFGNVPLEQEAGVRQCRGAAMFGVAMGAGWQQGLQPTCPRWYQLAASARFGDPWN